MDTSEGASKYYPGGRLKFDEKGRRVGAETVILQWRSGAVAQWHTGACLSAWAGSHAASLAKALNENPGEYKTTRQ